MADVLSEILELAKQAHALAVMEVAMTAISTKKVKFEPGDYVLVRTRNAGVHVGEFVARELLSVTLTNARRIWRWSGATAPGFHAETRRGSVGQCLSAHA